MSKVKDSPFCLLTNLFRIFLMLLDNFRRYSYCDTIIRNICNNHSIGTNVYIVSYFNSTQYFSTCANVTIISDNGTISIRITIANRNFMPNSAIIAYYRI